MMQQENNDYEQKFQLSKVLKNLDQGALDLLGYVMTSKEYLSLDDDNQDQNKDLRQDQKTIELDIQKLNNKQIQFLKNFAENPQTQMQYKQKLMINQLSQKPKDDVSAAAKEKNQPLQTEMQTHEKATPPALQE